MSKVSKVLGINGKGCYSAKDVLDKEVEVDEEELYNTIRDGFDVTDNYGEASEALVKAIARAIIEGKIVKVKGEQ